MEFLDERISVICDELKKLAVKNKHRITGWQMKEGNFITPEDADAGKGEWVQFDSSSMNWYGPDRHYWFKTDIKVPDEFAGKNLWMHVSTQIDEWDDAKNPQFLIFENGEPLQGMDVNHREVRLNQGNGHCRIDLQSYTGILHDEFSLCADLYENDEAITDLYYDLWVPLQAFTRMDKDDHDRLALTKALNDTINLLDLREPYSENFYCSVKRASAYIKLKVYKQLAGNSDVIASCIGHTHIDVAWWWTVEQTREKVGRSFSTVLKLMDEYPEYRFMSSQPQLYEFLKERYPMLYEKVKQRIKEKRWEPEGGMWVEADCNLTSGESLVRQFIYGKRFFREEFGIDNKILWLPDVFGYSGALPQIMKKCGIDYFQTTKIAWNQYNKFPYDTMLWRGIDGTEILTHMCTTVSVGQDASQMFTTYNGMLHPDSIMGGWKRYQQKNINNDILVSFGYGDGGGGPTRQMLETSKRMEKGICGIPKVRQVFARQFFDELAERLRDNKDLPVWEGELYFEYHRGTYTSMARNKRSNRKCELMLMDAELFSVIAEKAGVKYPHKKLDEMWKKVLLNQFHDILPGSSIKEVYDVTAREYAELVNDGEKLIVKCLKKNVHDGDGMTIFNTLGFERDDVIKIPENIEALEDEKGMIYPVQKCEDGNFAYLKGIPSKGYKVFKCCTGNRNDNKLRISREGILTPFYNISFSQDGFITSLYDMENDREVIKNGERANLMKLFEDKPIYYDDWNIDRYYTEKSWDVSNVVKMQWTEKGPVRATLEIERKVSRSLIRQKIHFYADIRRIDFETYVDYHEHQHLLKVFFPTNIHSDEAVFDIQFGNLKRKVNSNTSWDVARFESCGQKWMDFSEGHYGVGLLNDCKYGYSVKDGIISLTLIKAGIEPNPDSDNEEHYFTYSLFPHAGNYSEGMVQYEAAKLNQPAYVCQGGKIDDSFSFASVNKRNVYLETVKKAEDDNGIIIRLYEYENALTKCHISLGALKVKRIEETNCIEEKCADTAVSGDGFDAVIKPYEIKTYRIIV